MTGAERGFLLLTSLLGDPNRKPLTTAQLRQLGRRAREMEITSPDRKLTQQDLMSLGYGGDMACRIIDLLSEDTLLDYYVSQGRRADCVPITRASKAYPAALRSKLGDDAPGCLWAKGNAALLRLPKISLVGSRDLREDNRRFAAEVGRQAARQGYVLVSGNARGADRVAQEACLQYGGCVISVVADNLANIPMRDGVLYLSEDGYDMTFSAQRAISRNRVIHALGEKTFVAQSDFGHGGTWDGTVKNLRSYLSAVYCFRDESPAQLQFVQMGATAVDRKGLEDLAALAGLDKGLFDQ